MPNISPASPTSAERHPSAFASMGKRIFDEKKTKLKRIILTHKPILNGMPPSHHITPLESHTTTPR